MEEQLRFQKGHIQSDIGTSGRRVITAVAFLMSGITHKNTTKRTGIKFATLIFVEMNESHTSKDSGSDTMLKYKNYERIFVCGNFLCILLLVGGHIYNTTKPEWASK